MDSSASSRRCLRHLSVSYIPRLKKSNERYNIQMLQAFPGRFTSIPLCLAVITAISRMGFLLKWFARANARMYSQLADGKSYL